MLVPFNHAAFLPMLILLFAGHALCDYPLQGQYLSDSKNHRKPGIGNHWLRGLFAHASIHAGMVLLVTGSTTLALAELLIHGLTDWMKCDGLITSTEDQTVHYFCKVLWAALIAIGFH